MVAGGRAYRLFRVSPAHRRPPRRPTKISSHIENFSISTTVLDKPFANKICIPQKHYKRRHDVIVKLAPLYAYEGFRFKSHRLLRSVLWNGQDLIRFDGWVVGCPESLDGLKCLLSCLCGESPGSLLTVVWQGGPERTLIRSDESLELRDALEDLVLVGDISSCSLDLVHGGLDDTVWRVVWVRDNDLLLGLHDGSANGEEGRQRREDGELHGWRVIYSIEMW